MALEPTFQKTVAAAEPHTGTFSTDRSSTRPGSKVDIPQVTDKLVTLERSAYTLLVNPDRFTCRLLGAYDIVQNAVTLEPLTLTVTSFVSASPSPTPPKSDENRIFDQPGNDPLKLVKEWDTKTV